MEMLEICKRINFSILKLEIEETRRGGKVIVKLQLWLINMP
jgi:hypothetical protein